MEDEPVMMTTAGVKTTIPLPRDLAAPGTERTARYTTRERRLFKLLLRLSQRSVDGVESTKITRLWYADEEEVPINGQVIVRSMLTRMADKLRRNREPFEIISTPREGPKPSRYSVVTRSQRQ